MSSQLHVTEKREAGASEFSREAKGKAATAIRMTAAARTTAVGWDGPAVLLYKVINEV